MSPDFVPNKKELINDITVGFLPKVVRVPLVQEKNIECSPLVNPGQKVVEGQVIGEAVEKDYASAKIHSPIPGVVKDIVSCTFPDGKFGKAVEIFLSGKFSFTGKRQNFYDSKSYDSSSILKMISDGGVINTFASRSPVSLAEQINRIKQMDEPVLFVRLYDEDPCVQTDMVLSRTYSEMLVDGIKIILKVLDAKKLVVATSRQDVFIPAFVTSKEELDEEFGVDVTVVNINQYDYPAGGNREIASRYKKQVKSDKSVTSIIKEAVFVDTVTAISVSEAVSYKIPSEKVFVHVAGNSLKSSAVLKVCVGESFASIAKMCGIERKNIGRIIVNGYMNGYAVPDIDAPVTKYVKSIFFIAEHDIFNKADSVCLRCGKCAYVCRSKLSPYVLYDHVINGVKIPQQYIDSASLCSGCSLCNSECPANLPLSQIIQIVKEKKYER